MSYNLTVAEAAERLGVGTSRVYQLIQLGELSAEKFGRTWMVDASSVEDRVAHPRAAGRPRKTSPASEERQFTLMNRGHRVLDFSCDAASGAFVAAGEIHDPQRAPLGVVSPRGRQSGNRTSWKKSRKGHPPARNYREQPREVRERGVQQGEGRHRERLREHLQRDEE